MEILRRESQNTREKFRIFSGDTSSDGSVIATSQQQWRSGFIGATCQKKQAQLSPNNSTSTPFSSSSSLSSSIFGLSVTLSRNIILISVFVVSLLHLPQDSILSISSHPALYSNHLPPLELAPLLLLRISSPRISLALPSSPMPSPSSHTSRQSPVHLYLRSHISSIVSWQFSAGDSTASISTKRLWSLWKRWEVGLRLTGVRRPGIVCIETYYKETTTARIAQRGAVSWY
jgi:hypothetical protein